MIVLFHGYYNFSIMSFRMSKITVFLRKRWRAILTLVTLAALVGATYSLRHQIVDTIRNLDNINLWIVLFVVVFQAAFYHFSANMYKNLFSILGSTLKYKFLMRATLELTFVNHVFPSGGVTGFSYWGLRLRSEGVSTAKATLVQTMRFVLLFISFQILLFLALILLSFDGRVNNFLLVVSGSLATALVGGTLFMMYIIGDKKRINNFFTVITKIINRLIQVVRPKNPETINIDRAKGVFEDFHENYKVLKKDYKKLKQPVINALLINLVEILSIYAVFLAFGQWVNLGAIIIAYAVANFAGLISVIPGGIGLYEGLMIGVLVAGGVPAALSLPVIIMYRILTIFLQIPLGGYLYYKTIHQGN